MSDLKPFPDVEVAVMDILERDFEFDLGPGDVGGVTPFDLGRRLAGGRNFVRVAMVTGRDDRLTAFSVVDVDVFASTRDGARDLAERIRAHLLGYPLTVGTVTLDRVVTETAPIQAPWEDENVRRRLATYRISTRR